MRKLLFVAAGLLLAGCTTTPVSEATAKPVPADRILGYQSEISAGGVLVVTRDSGAFGSGCYLGIYINGAPAARIGPGEIAKFQVPAGEHLIGMGKDPNGRVLCAIDGMALREIQATVSAGQTRRYRVFGDLNAGFSISPTSF